MAWPVFAHGFHGEQDFPVDFLVIAGGGGGGANGAGGGAGGYRELLSQKVKPNKSYTITIGAGGAGGAGRIRVWVIG